MSMSKTSRENVEYYETLCEYLGEDLKDGYEQLDEQELMSEIQLLESKSLSVDDVVDAGQMDEENVLGDGNEANII